MGGDELDEASIARVRSELMHRVQTEASAARRTRTRRIGIAGGAGLAVLALTGAAIAVVQAGQDEIDGTIRCFAAMDAHADYTTATEAQVEGTVPDEAFSRHAIEVCAALWEVGTLANGRVEVPQDPNKVDYSAPELIACTLPDGVTGVFPDENTLGMEACQQLGFRPGS